MKFIILSKQIFRENKLAALSFFMLLILYLLIIFAGFISPYSPTEEEFRDYFYHPPKFFHFIDQDSTLHLRPFVYPIFIVDKINNIYSEGRPLCVKIKDPKYNEEPFLLDSIRKIKYEPIIIKNKQHKIIGVIKELTETETNSGIFIGCYPSSPYDFKKSQTYFIEFRNPSTNDLILSTAFKAIKSPTELEDIAEEPPKNTLAPNKVSLATVQHATTDTHKTHSISISLVNENGKEVKNYNYYVETYPIKFFAKGFTYWLLKTTDTHLFKPSEGGYIFLFGTDQNGRDIFSRTLYGARVSLTIGIVGALLSSILGLIIGGVSGYYGGLADNIIMRLTEILMSIPAIYLILAIRNIVPNEFGEIYIKIIIFFEQCYSWKNNLSKSLLILLLIMACSLLIIIIRKGKINHKNFFAITIFLLIFLEGNDLVKLSIIGISKFIPPETTITSQWTYFWIVIIISLIGWASLARIIRGLVLSLKQSGYVLAAKALGASDFYILRKHILPQTYRFVIIRATLLIPFYILSEIALSFLGVGIQEPDPSWGNMLQYAQNIKVLQSFPWMLIPGIFLFIVILSFNFLGDFLSRYSRQ